ncbi:TonB-dependent receptor [Halotalea alkalilenta]|uniref:TonB-dependent receptor n=1 Tax=Halotalea alkalilenta TaxID=376489 RepID=UPI000693B97F|nr:TonB-dependent receptor [Halotalea alkalilenta]
MSFDSRRPSAVRWRRLAARGGLAAALGCTLGASLPVLAQQSAAQPGAVRSYAIPAGPLGPALMRFASESGINLVLDPQLVAGRTTPGVQGSLSVAQGFSGLLQGSGLESVPSGNGGYVLIERSAQSGSLDTLTVIGTRFVAGNDQLVPEYAGGQVASGGRLGVLGQQQAFDVPFNITSYTAKRVEDRQAKTLGDVLKSDASVQVGSGYGNYAESFRIRGFTLSGDDVSFGGLYGVLPRQVVVPNAIERVEVLKGASAFLNGVPPGGSGVGGSINLEPKRAGDEPLLRTTLGYATDGYGEAAVDAGRRFGVDGQFGARINLLRGSGGSPVSGDDDERSSSFALALDYRGERLRSSLDVGYQKQVYQGMRRGIYLGSELTEMPQAPSPRTNYTPSWAYSKIETSYGMWRGEYDFAPNWTGYLALGGNDTEEYGVYSSPTVNNLAGDATVGRMDVPFEAKSFASQAGVRGSFDTGAVSHSVNLGYSGVLRRSYSAYRMTSNSDTNIYHPVDVPAPTDYYDFPGGDMDDPNLRNRVRANGVSFSDTLSMFDDRLRLLAGVRYQELTVRNYSYEGAPENAFDESAYTPVYGIVYQPWQTVSFYANYVQALQQGPTVPSTEGYPNAGQVLGTVRSKQYEAGVKFDYGRIGGGISLFQIEQPNASGDGQVYALNGEQKNRGLELSVFGEPLIGWRLLGGVTFMDAELSGTTDGANDGNDAIGVPKYQANLGSEWDLPGVEGLTLTGDVVRTGSQYADDGNQYRLEPWTRLDLGVRYATRLAGSPVTWRAGIENVTNDGYWESVGESGYVTQGMPRLFKLSMSVDL